MNGFSVVMLLSMLVEQIPIDSVGRLALR